MEQNMIKVNYFNFSKKRVRTLIVKKEKKKELLQ